LNRYSSNLAVGIPLLGGVGVGFSERRDRNEVKFRFIGIRGGVHLISSLRAVVHSCRRAFLLFSKPKTSNSKFKIPIYKRKDSKMKRTILITLVILAMLQVNSFAQDNNAHSRNPKLGITFSSLGESDVFRFDELDGAAHYEGDYFLALGVNYLYPLSNWLEVESGIEFLKHRIVYDPIRIPEMSYSLHTDDLYLVNIPVTLRVNFLKYFFVNGGLLFEVDASTDSPIDNQTGIGSLFGIAAKYDFKNGISVFLNPYAKMHSLVPFSNTKYHQRIWENGVRVGCTYTMKQK
jgi:hypothetical protein